MIFTAATLHRGALAIVSRREVGPVQEPPLAGRSWLATVSSLSELSRRTEDDELEFCARSRVAPDFTSARVNNIYVSSVQSWFLTLLKYLQAHAENRALRPVSLAGHSDMGGHLIDTA